MATFEPKHFGKYYLIEKLAIGGMAEIYKAKTYGVDGFEKLLAVKRILPHCSADRDFITMLVDEAKLSVTLSHANIVQVYDLGKVGEDYFISMEYINGVNLRDIIYRCREKNIKIPDELAVYILSEVCKGLDYAHRKTDAGGTPLNIVHRDVSPQNILISFDGEVKIVDFGIAKAAMNISHTMAGILKGKIAYMSPEQALGKTVDYKTDLFSAGIILYETLSLEKLFTGESQFEVLKKIRSTKIDSTKLPESVPEGLKPALAKALAYYTKDRYQSAGDMQIDLTRYLYTTHVDFTPQKLAAFITELFSEEISKQREAGVKEKIFESQTSSINIAEEALQENIVHREDTSPTARSDTGGIESSLELIEPTDKVGAPKSLQKRLLGMLIALVLLGGISFALFKFVRPMIKDPSASLQGLAGTLQVTSAPDGAAIYVDDKETGLNTPAILENLAIGKIHTVKLSKEGFAETQRTVSVGSAEPISLNVDLEEALSVLEIVSEPEGAAIFIDGNSADRTTPHTMKGLELNKDIKITLKKDGFQDFNQDINLGSYKPQVLTARLAPAAKLGTIKISSVPDGALIILNGRDTGLATPADLQNLPIGEKQNIRITKTGFDAESRTVALEDTAPVELKFELKSVEPALKEPAKEPSVEKPASIKPAPAAPSKRPPAPAREPAAVERTPVEKAPAYPASAAPAAIKVASSPGNAEIFINGEYKGTTPATVTDIRPGLVSVLVNKEGKARFSKKITLAPGESIDLGTVKLSDIVGSISIKTIPSGARVFLDGEDLGARTPLTIKKVRRDRQHTLKLELDGYQAYERTFEMGEENDKKFIVTMEK